MNKVLQYFKDNSFNNILNQEITVFGWQNKYQHQLISSVSKYLFEDLAINDNIAPLNDNNRPGTVKPKQYITIHDTGDADPIHSAKFWSETVFNQSWEQRPGEIVPYACSYQYVVDNEGVYHNIPDQEVAYHAGDGTRFDYVLYPTGVDAITSKPIITISDDGYYQLNGNTSLVKAPRIYREKNGEVLEDRVAKTTDLNDQSVLCKVVNGKYFIGETYFSSGYRYICNRGGNNNSIGIETCINENTDLYYTWQKTAKLVAYLLDNNNLTIDDVVQHHYFSGKDCPMTIRHANLWGHFLELVKFELQIRMFMKEGFKIELVTNDKRVKANGRIIEVGTDPIRYIIRTTKDNMTEELELEIS